MENDARILELKEKIALKREAIATTQNNTYQTNCIIAFEGSKKNLRVLKKDDLILLACQLHELKKSSEELDYELTLSGFPVDSWLSDIKCRIVALDAREEHNKLKEMESKLSTFLSDKKRVELELEEIEKTLL